MTADEEGLPPIDPDDIHAVEYNTAARVMQWLVECVWKLDITDEQRTTLNEVFRDDQFQKITKDLESGMIFGAIDPTLYGEVEPTPDDEPTPEEDNTE